MGIRRRYEVRWYEYNLTQERRRKFFTEIGATLYHVWLYFIHGITSHVYERESY